MKEIGSEFWWDGELYKNINTNIPSIFSDYSSFILTTTGRGTIKYLIDELGLVNKKVLLPSYICESVILPFEKANCDIEYFDLNLDLSPKFDSKLNISNYDVLLHLGYFGFETNSKINLFLKNNNEDITIIEDVTHSLFTQKSKKSDYYVGSIRKWLGIPSGGFISTDKSLDGKISMNQNSFAKLRKEALIEKNYYMKSSSINDKSYLDKFNAAEVLIDEDISAYRIDNDSLNIVQNYNYRYLIDKRRRNFSYLLTNINETQGLKFVFTDLKDEVCPLFFPLYVDNRDSFREFLKQNDIYCPIHWPIPSQISTLSENAKYIYNHIISIPCDQRYDKKDMERIIEVINLWNINRSC